MMSTAFVFSVLLAGVVAWTLVVRQLTARSWEPGRGSTAELGGDGDVGPIGLEPAKIGLWMFMAVVTSLFSLFFAAYAMRMHQGTDWSQLQEPPLLWINTVVLALASVALEYTRRMARRGDRRRLRAGLIVGGVLTFAFIGGQLGAWDQLTASGRFLTSGPAIAFFYVLTALHGLHVLGGLFVWGKTMGRLSGGAEAIDVRLSVELCATYWHFMLVVWLVLFGLLSTGNTRPVLDFLQDCISR